MNAVPAALRSVLLATLILDGAAAADLASAPDVPEALRPPQGQTVFLEALASGVQIYECAAKAANAPGFEWVFRSPEAALADRAGHPIGKHYAGPTWEANDGSTVVGEVKAKDPGPTPTAIPWLLLGAKSRAGTGVLSATQSIQRVSTVGGVAPATPCDAATSGKVARVPYTATYYFYRAAP